MWISRALAQFKGNERYPGLFQDFEDGFVKFKTSHYTVSRPWCSRYDLSWCRFSIKEFSVRNLWIANF